MKLNLKRSGAFALAALALAACQTGPTLFRPQSNVGVFSNNRLPMQTVSLRWQTKAQIRDAANAGIDLFGAKPSARMARATVSSACDP